MLPAKRLIWIGLIVAAVFLVELAIGSGQSDATLQAGSEFAPLPEVSVPVDNPMTDAKVELGRLLFFDSRMSGDGSVSCNSCHPADAGWGAPTAISFGGPGTSHWRNAPTVLNVAFYNGLNWDGSKKSLEVQASGAWGGAVAGNLDKALGEERLAQIPEYVERFKDVFGTDTPRWDDATKALASYQRTLISENVPFDAFITGDDGALTGQEQAGFDLFDGKAGCSNCHNGALLSDNGYHALGVPQNPEFFNSPLKQITFRYEQWAKGTPEEIYRTATEDLGRFYVTKEDSDMGAFRTPGLRDVCYTSPYMHNGVFSTLDAVVAFYNEGGGTSENLDPLLSPLDLTEDEQADLVAFLSTGLCGDEVTDTAPELPPYGVIKP